MKNLCIIILTVLVSITGFTQERQNAILPNINAVAKGKLTESTGWMQNESGEWLSRKNRIPSDLSGEFKTLIDYQHHGLGEERENFIYIERREVTINDSVYTILIKKYKDGWYKYSSIKEGWSPENSLDYFVFNTSALEKLKNLEPDKTYNIRITSIYSNTIEYLEPKSSLKTIAQDLSKIVRSNDKYRDNRDLVINIRLYKNKVRFIIDDYYNYSFGKQTLEKSYYETTYDNFIKLFDLK